MSKRLASKPFITQCRIIVKGDNSMKKNILSGIFSPLFYFLVVNLMRYTILAGEYKEETALLHNLMIMVMSAMPGVALMFLLIRNSMKEYFKSLSICFCISLVVMIVYMFSGIELMIYTAITGYEEMSLGDGIVMAVTMGFYLVSCLVGSIVAGVVTLIKKRKIKKNLETN